MLRVFTAKSIITMNASLPRATAVAVRDGQIIEVGSLESMQPWLDAHPHRLDDRFSDAIMVPGLIDPHLHPTMAAVLLPMVFITAMQWRFPWGTTEPTTTADAYDKRLAEVAAENTQELLITWGHHALWHGEMSRARINAIDSTTPIVVWNRSFHEVCMNDGALALLGIDQESVGKRQQIDLPRGRFFENGLGYAIQKLNPWILAPDRLHHGLERLRDVVHFGGHTTIADLAVGIFDFDTEMAGLTKVLDQPTVPFRTELVANALALSARHDEAALAQFIDELPARNTDKLNFRRRVKLFADGAFFAEIAQLQAPGYIDGHAGEWLMVPEKLESAARTYWNQGYQIHVHVTGDLGVELALDVLEKLQWERPRFNHGYTLEHFGFCTPEQIDRAAALGAQISANVYYLHELSAIYANRSVGYERASSMARLGSAVGAGITTALHSDFTMAPAQPLNSMWVAVNRVNASGDLMGEHERLSPQQGLAAITIDAAKVLGRAEEIGSIRAGKKADFTILAQDPLTIDPMQIKDIPIIATVFEGTAHPIV